MKVIILAGGKGTRLHPLTKKIPKPMILINGKPIILRIIEIYLNYGDSILSVGDRLKVIQEGREIIDQDTGLSLGSRQKTLGEIEIISTEANLSIAKITKEDSDFTIGSVAKMILNDPNSKNKTQRERKGRKI